MITIETTINADLAKVWDRWIKPEHIVKWNFASDDWHCLKAENDLMKEGKFSSTMAAKDGSFSFDFSGTYAYVEELKRIESIMEDGRKMSVSFIKDGTLIKVVEEFEPEKENNIEMQKAE